MRLALEDAGAAYVELLVNNSALVRGLKAASAKLRAFGATVSAMGANMVPGASSPTWRCGRWRGSIR